jgi:hypothetical protein
MLKYFSLGPILSPRVDQATATEPLNRSRWQQGTTVAANAFEQPFSAFGALHGLSGVVVGIGAAVALSGLPLFLQLLIGGLVWLAVYWAVPTTWAGIAGLHAPIVQRDQAREYARALEAHIHAYAQWAARREIGYRFRHDTFEDLKRIAGGQLMGSLSDEEDRWRNLLTQACTQMEDNGADLSAFLEGQLTQLDDPDGLYGGNDEARIRNSMLSACQNLLAEMLNQPPPTPPAPPQLESVGRAFQ